jgi:hypothetical protein
LPHLRAPPSIGWRAYLAEQCNPFAPAPLQNLPRYYGSLRPCAPRRYSGPCGFSHLDVSLGIGTTGSHVPYESLMRARAVFTPDAVRSEPGLPPNSSRGIGKPPVLTPPNPLSTLQRRFACARLPAPYLPRSSLGFLQRSPPSLFTTAACSGLKPAPDRRLRGACPHLSYSIAPPRYVRDTLPGAAARGSNAARDTF